MATVAFQPGDLVEIKSGSPKLTVVWSGDDTTLVIYYDNGFEQQELPTAALQIFKSKTVVV